MMVSCGKSAASASIAEGCAWRDLRAHAARHAGAHAGHADIDHHRHAERGDLLEQRVVARIVDREVLHDRMEVEADQLEIVHRMPGLVDRVLALGRLDRAPRLDDALGCRFRMAAT